MGRLFAFEKDKPRMAADLFLISEKMHLLTHKWDKLLKRVQALSGDLRFEEL